MGVASKRPSWTSAWVIGVAVALLCGGRPQAQQPAALALENMFERGAIFEDRNDDEVIDFVHARLVVGQTPTPAEIAAAANVAARLGFETMALDVPLASDEDTDATVIAVGRRGVARAGLSTADVGLDTLEAGEGLVRVVDIDGRRGLIVAGADEDGTRAAATLFAGRLPHVWDPKGPSLADVLDDLREFLDQEGTAPREVVVADVRAVDGGDAIERLTLTAHMEASGDVTQAEQALDRLIAEREQVDADTQDDEEQDEEDDEGPVLSYPGALVVRVELVADGASPVAVDLDRVAGPEPGPLGGRPGSGMKRNLDLSSVYANDGFLGDANSDLIPDRTDVVLVPFGEGIDGTIDLAARIGLEVTGLSVPLVRTPDEIDRPGSEPTLILIGTSHPLINDLIEDEKLTLPDLEPGQGLIQVVRPAFGTKTAVVITGGDAVGVRRAIQQVADRFPHVWERGKDRTTVDNIEDDVRKFLSGRSPAGQAATALYKLEQIADELSERDLESVEVKVYVDKPAAGLGAIVQRTAAAALQTSELDVVVESLDVQEAKPISVNGTPISAEIEIPSEVDEFWQIFRSQVTPAVSWDEPVTVTVRLSEPPTMRARIAQQATEEIVDAGARLEDVSVTVLSAYKQGYSWLYDEIRPQLASQSIEQIVIRFAEIGPPPGWQQQAMFTPTRWLLELHPIDEVLARELGLALEKITFEKMPIGSPTYEVIARREDGREVLRETFEPALVVRPFFDQFPDYEKVRVPTGWLNARVGDREVTDARIITDPERFWDYYQGTTLPAVYDYVMALHDGKPRAADAPHFGELTVELTLSEPDYQIGVDQEQIAPMEALHEEVYFATLHFFDVLGRYARGQALNYPGRVIPIMQAKSDGTPGSAKISFTGFGSSRPAVVVEYREQDGRTGEIRRDIPKVTIDRPAALAAIVRDGRNGLERLDLRVKVDTENDQRAELVQRTRAERVDQQMISAEQAVAVVANLERLREAGMYQDAVAYHDVGELRVVAGWEHEIDTATQRTASLVRGGRASPFPDVKALLRGATRIARGGQGPIVQWDTPIPPPEAYATLAVMGEYPEASVYKVGQSYLGKDVWAMDLMSPIEASHWSHAKATTFKPTVIYSARQHANEVSSTSHVLKLAELLLTDPAFKPQLKKVNVVIHPITNADGAQLAYDLYQRTPDHMLHAGYLGALGVDVSAGQWDSDPIYPESSIRPQLWRTWLPDIFMNPHGYPSHEWVQLFSEYAGWVRNRVTQSRDWWGMRGWFMPGFGYLDDPRYPRHKDAAFAIRDLITEHINAVPEVRALNRRAYARYRRLWLRARR